MNLQAAIDLNCVVVKEGGQYCVKSEDRSKNLGCKPSKAGAKKRLRQVEYFKHLKAGGQGSGRHKVSTKAEQLLLKLGYKRDERIVNSPFGKAYRHPDRPHERVHVSDENSSSMDAGGPGSGRHKEIAEESVHKLSKKEKDLNPTEKSHYKYTIQRLLKAPSSITKEEADRIKKIADKYTNKAWEE